MALVTESAAPSSPVGTARPSWWRRPGAVAVALGWSFVACVLAAVLLPTRATYHQVKGASRYDVTHVESRTVTCVAALPFVGQGIGGRPPQVGDSLLPGSSAWSRTNACAVARGERYAAAFGSTLLAVLAFHTARRRRSAYAVEPAQPATVRDAAGKATALVLLAVAVPVLLSLAAGGAFAAADGSSLIAGVVGAALAVLGIAAVKAWQVLQRP